MKQYNVKYDIDQEVYVLQSKTISKTHIDEIKIIQARPYYDGNNNLKEMDGVRIQYLVMIKQNGSMRSYDWFDQKDVFTDREELIRRIE